MTSFTLSCLTSLLPSRFLLVAEPGMAGGVDATSSPFDGADVKPAAGTLTLTLEGFFIALLSYVSTPISEDNRHDDTRYRGAATEGNEKNLMTATSSSTGANSSMGEQPEEKNDSAVSFGLEKGEKDGLDGVKRAGGVEQPVGFVMVDSSSGPVPLSHLVAHHFMLQTSRALVRLLMTSSVTTSIREEAAAGAKSHNSDPFNI